MGAPRVLGEVFGRKKSFTGVIGSPVLNQLGLHPARIAVTDACVAIRRVGHGVPGELRDFARDGVAVVPDLLPAATFAAIRAEVRAAIDAAERDHPRRRVSPDVGFGPKRPFPGGFDRFDGGTLNRFLEIEERLPVTAAAIREPRVARICTYASGFRHRPSRFHVYLTVHGDERLNPDPQRATHRDTFHSTVKLWLFLDEVRAADGPLEYVVGSHRIDAARRRWEYARALAATRPGGKSDGSFRISDDELRALGLAPPRPFPVPGNTLVVADVRGFHRRGDAPDGAQRLALYANLRLWPFSPIAY